MLNEKYIVYGAGRIGKRIVDLLLKQGKKIEMIYDRAPKKEFYCGVPIINPFENSVLLDKNKNAIVLIGIDGAYINEEIYSYLKEKGYSSIYKFSESEYNHITEVLCKEDNKIEENCTQCVYVETCFKLMNLNMQKISDNYLLSNKKIIQVLNVGVTNRCILNCQCCVQCTQEIRKKGIFFDLTLSALKKYIDILKKEISYIHQICLSGGELLLNKELPEILEYLCELKEIGYIKVLTTLTIRLSKDLLEKLKNPKVICCIDDYGSDKNIPTILQDNLKYNISKLNEVGVLYSIIDNSDGTWYDLGESVERREDPLENMKKNKGCMFRSCLILSANGLLSWCARNVACLQCGLIPNDHRDYCDLNKMEDEVRIREILELDYLHGCEFCEGAVDSFNIVPAGMQSDMK